MKILVSWSSTAQSLSTGTIAGLHGTKPLIIRYSRSLLLAKASTFFPNISWVWRPRGRTISLCHLPAKRPLCPHCHVRRTSEDSSQLCRNLGNHLSKLTGSHKLSVWLWAHCLNVFVVWPSSLLQEEDEAVCVWTDRAAECFWENASALPCELWENSTVVQRMTTKWGKKKCVCTTNNIMLWQETNRYTTVCSHWHALIMKGSNVWCGALQYQSPIDLTQSVSQLLVIRCFCLGLDCAFDHSEVVSWLIKNH